MHFTLATSKLNDNLLACNILINGENKYFLFSLEEQ